MKRFVLIALLLTAWVAPAAAHDVKKISKADLVKRDGLFYEKFSNTPFTGKTTTGAFRAAYKNGRLHGVFEHYYRSGQLWKIELYKDGVQHGEQRIYHENGQLAEAATYKSNQLTGPYSRWWPNGQLRSKGTLEDGTREGRWVDFNEDGTPDPKKTGTYQMDVRIGP